MTIREVDAKSILRKHKRVDSWFISCYGMNLYRGCTHNCVYCDGRAEKYNVDGVFGQDVVVKKNAIELLNRELDPKRRRVPFKSCYMMVGGGVGDSYQPVEEKYQLCRKALELLDMHHFPISILTKSTLIKRDIDLLKEIGKKKNVIVSFSFSTVDEGIASIFEPGVPSPYERLEAIKFLKREGITCGMFLMPVIPFITDTPDQIEASLRKAKEAGVDFIIFSGMTLKGGTQQQVFMDTLRQYFPNLISEYLTIYRGNRWGAPTEAYYRSIHKTFYTIAKKYKIQVRIPHKYFKDVLNENDLVIVILEHIDYLLKLRGEKSPYGFAAYTITGLTEKLSSFKGKLTQFKGIGPTTERIICEILDTGTSRYYEKLMQFI